VIRTALFAALLAAVPASADEMGTAYTRWCSGCHGAGGAGVPERGIPDLHDAGAYAGGGLGRRYLAQVPGLSQSPLDDAEAARLLNYVLRRFSSDRLPEGFRPYDAAEVAALRADKASDAPARRAAALREARSEP
jgi:mono/diheme cytochrome c family protein